MLIVYKYLGKRFGLMHAPAQLQVTPGNCFFNAETYSLFFVATKI